MHWAQPRFHPVSVAQDPGLSCHGPWSEVWKLWGQCEESFLWRGVSNKSCHDRSHTVQGARGVCQDHTWTEAGHFAWRPCPVVLVLGRCIHDTLTSAVMCCQCLSLYTSSNTTVARNSYSFQTWAMQVASSTDFSTWCNKGQLAPSIPLAAKSCTSRKPLSAGLAQLFGYIGIYTTLHHAIKQNHQTSGRPLPSATVQNWSKFGFYSPDF